MNKLKLLLLNLLTTVVAAEILLRIAGFAPLYKYAVVSNPPGCMAPSTQFGFQLNAGNFVITINDSLKYTTTQAAGPVSVNRITRATGSPAVSDSLVFLAGCSFTYGMGVDDSLTYPYRLQSRLQEYAVVNSAVPAYGTLQALLITQRLVEKGIYPHILIYNYIDAHRARNVLSRPFRQLLLNESSLDGGREAQLRETARFPYGEIRESDGRLAIQFATLKNRNLFYSLRSWSALVNQLEYAYNHFSAAEQQADTVTKATLLEIDRLCKENNINFIVAVLKDADDGPSMQQFCVERGIPTVGLSVDYTDPGLLNLPYDGHPNAKAHAIYADKMYDYLTREKWINLATATN